MLSVYFFSFYKLLLRFTCYHLECRIYRVYLPFCPYPPPPQKNVYLNQNLNVYRVYRYKGYTLIIVHIIYRFFRTPPPKKNVYFNQNLNVWYRVYRLNTVFSVPPPQNVILYQNGTLNSSRVLKEFTNKRIVFGYHPPPPADDFGHPPFKSHAPST